MLRIGLGKRIGVKRFGSGYKAAVKEMRCPAHWIGEAVFDKAAHTGGRRSQPLKQRFVWARWNNEVGVAQDVPIKFREPSFLWNGLKEREVAVWREAHHLALVVGAEIEVGVGKKTIELANPEGIEKVFAHSRVGRFVESLQAVVQPAIERLRLGGVYAVMVEGAFPGAVIDQNRGLLERACKESGCCVGVMVVDYFEACRAELAFGFAAESVPHQGVAAEPHFVGDHEIDVGGFEGEGVKAGT